MTNTTNTEPTTKAVLSLVFGILAIAGACPCIGGLLAVILGSGEKSGVGRAGWILGLIHFAMLALALMAGLIVACIAAIAAAADH